VLSDILKKPCYKAGDTLKLILPFLKAYNVTDKKMREFSAKTLILIASVKDTLNYVKNVVHAFIVSTSYEHYMQALCQALDFPYENTYCTRLNIDKYTLPEKEKTKLRQIAKEIAQMPMIEIPSESKFIKDLSEKDQKTIRRLDEIFWKEMASMDSRRILDEVNPIGGNEKAEAVKDAVQRLGTTIADVMYIGDSITDVEAFKLVKDSGGLAVSFNGNQYAVRNAEIAVLCENSIITAVITDSFGRFGKQQTLSLIENWHCETLDKSQVSRTLLNSVFRLFPKELPKVKIITSKNMETLAKESSELRKKVRGEAIGSLG